MYLQHVSSSSGTCAFPPDGGDDGRYVLRLFITGSTPRSLRAVGTLKQVCEQFLRDRYDLEVVDIYQRPAAARSQQILAAPTLVRDRPAPSRRLVGDLSDRQRLLEFLDISGPRPGKPA